MPQAIVFIQAIAFPWHKRAFNTLWNWFSTRSANPCWCISCSESNQRKLTQLRRVNHKLDIEALKFLQCWRESFIPRWRSFLDIKQREQQNFIDNPCNAQLETTLYSTNEDSVLAFPGLAPQLIGRKVFHVGFLFLLQKSLRQFWRETALLRSCNSTRRCCPTVLQRKKPTPI